MPDMVAHGRSLVEIAEGLGRKTKYTATAKASRIGALARSVAEDLDRPGAPLDEAEPFAPGTVSGGAIVAKTVQNIVAGMRANANSRVARQQQAEAQRVQGMHTTLLQRQIDDSTLEDWKDESGQTHRLTRAEIRGITTAQAKQKPAAPTVDRTLSDGTVVKVSPSAALADDDRDAARLAATNRKPAVRDPGPGLERVKKALDERVEVDAADQMARFGNRRIASVRARALNGDREALGALGIPIAVVQELLGPTGDSASGTYTLGTMVDERIKNWLQPRLLDSARRFARKKYASHYGAIDRALGEAAGLKLDDETVDTDPVLSQIQRLLDEAEAEE